MRGTPEGKPRVDIGEPAPLNTDELKIAHGEGKAILLMFGNPDQCIYCEKVWRSIIEMQEEYPNNVAAIVNVHQAAEFLGPESDALALGKAYGVAGEPWLFLIDRGGIIRHIYKGFIGKPEIEADLKKALDAKDKR